jgi:uncharacterized protein
MNKLFIAALVAASATAQVQAQPDPSSAPAPGDKISVTGAPVSSAAKKELLQRVMVLQQPSIDSLARDLPQRPLRPMLMAAEQALTQRVAPDQRQGVANQVDGLVRKYLDEATPIVRAQANKLGQTVVLPMLDEKFSEEELRQLVSALDNPAFKKYQQTLPEISNTLVQKLVAEIEPQLTPKVRTLEQGIASALGLTGPGAASGPRSSAKPPAAAASKPAKK